MTQSHRNDHILKLLFVGDSCVGKSALIRRYCNDEFDSISAATIGVDFLMRNVRYGDKVYRMQMWDTAGQERFRSLTRAYYRDAHGVVICFDLTNADSFFNVKTWVNELLANSSDHSVPCVLVGTKCDLVYNRVVDYAKVAELAKSLGFPYMETSSKANVNLNALFESHLLPRMIERLNAGSLSSAAAFAAKPAPSVVHRCCNIV